MVKNQDLSTFGLEHAKIEYESFLDWLVQFSSLKHHWKNEPTYVLSQFAFLFGGVATFLHARKSKGRLPYLWIGTVLHGLVVECMCYLLPDVDNFWHSQTPIIFLGHRLPLHIIFLYPCFLYQASVAVGKLKLPKWSEPFAVGLCVVLIDIPYDIVSVNYLHWTWHDTDPNIYDRHYWVPWNSYYFHACFAASFTFWFQFFRRRFCRTDKWEADTCCRETACTIGAALLGAPGGVVLFTLIYHPLHDIYKIHSEVTFFIIFAIFLLIIWTGDRTARKSSDVQSKTFGKTYILLSHLIIHYATFLTIPILFKAEDEVAIGLKEPIGPCNEMVDLQTAFGLVLQKRKYLCAIDYDEKYFDWKCLPNAKPPVHGSIWYTACGVPIPNPIELVAIVALICLIAATVFINLHFNSFGDAVYNKISEKSVKKTINKRKMY